MLFVVNLMFSFSYSNRLVIYWLSHSYPQTVFLVPQSSRAGLPVSAIRCLSSFGFSNSAWCKTTWFTTNVLCSELLPFGQFCTQWFILSHTAHLVCTSYLSKRFLPILGLVFFGGGGFSFPKLLFDGFCGRWWFCRIDVCW